MISLVAKGTRKNEQEASGDWHPEGGSQGTRSHRGTSLPETLLRREQGNMLPALLFPTLIFFECVPRAQLSHKVVGKRA